MKLVPETGVEPARDRSHGILSPGRLPIPPLRPVWSLIIITQQAGIVKGAAKSYRKSFYPCPSGKNFPGISGIVARHRAYTDLYTDDMAEQKRKGANEMKHLNDRITDHTPAPKQDVDDLIFAGEVRRVSER